MQLIHGLLCIFMLFKIDETESFASTILITLNDSRADWSILGEQLLKLLVGDIEIQVLNIDIRKVCLHFVSLGHAFLAGNMMTNVNLLVVQKHTINILDSTVGSFT